MVIITDEEIKAAAQAQAEAERRAKFDNWRNEYLRERGAELMRERESRHKAVYGLPTPTEHSAVMGLETINKI